MILVMHLQRSIETLGYKPNEAKVYLAALGLGECHATDIAEKVDLPLSSVRAILDSLCEDGLVTFYIQKRYRFWVAEHPDRLIRRMERRSADARAILPALDALRKEGSIRRRHKGGHTALGTLRMIADASQSPMMITNEAAEIQYVNAAWERELGYALPEVVGKNPRFLRSGSTPSDTYERLWSALTTGRLFHSGDVVDVRKDGTHCALQTTIVRLEHEGSVWFLQIFDC